MSSARPDIFAYHDYLAYLKDWLAYRKASQSDFSLRGLAQRAGLASGYLPMVLSGKRVLSNQALSKLAGHLGWNAIEQTFFEQLLVLGTAATHEVRVAALDRMQRFRQFQQKSSNESTVYAYLTHWYYVVIRELATLPGFDPDPRWIQSRLQVAVPLKEIKGAVDFLLENKYITPSTDGSLRAIERPLDCSGQVHRVALAKFHREIFNLAGQSIDSTAREQRSILGYTCGLSAKSLEKAHAIANEAIAQIRNLGTHEINGEAIYHMEVALFPMTKAKGIAK